jgi:Flp pilus assembly protein TadD
MEELPGIEEIKTFPLDDKAMSQYALGSTKLIASLLIIPDAFALIPNAPNFTSWAIKLLGLWLSAAVLWFVSFSAILKLIKLVVAGVSLDSSGLRIWRFARPIAWEKIEAISVEDRAIFSRLFFLRESVRRLTIFESKENRSLLLPRYISSFLFSTTVFQELIGAISVKRFAFVPESANFVLINPNALPKLRKTNLAHRYQNILASFVIAIGLLSFLGKKAAVNFYYNSGNKQMVALNYQSAANAYALTVRLDPTFAFGWERLADSEAYLDNLKLARQNFKIALACKPDFVEAMLGLARLDLDDQQFAEAKLNIDSALRLVPDDQCALSAEADYCVRIGKLNAARQILRKLPNTPISQSNLACHNQLLARRCIEAELLWRDGAAKAAIDLLSKSARPLADRIGLRRYYVLYASIANALGDLDSAQSAVDQLIILNSHDRPALNAQLSLLLAKNDIDGAASILRELNNLAASDPETQLNTAVLHIKQGKTELARRELEKIAELRDIDKFSLSRTAALLAQLNAHQSAVIASARALLLGEEQ